MYCGVPFIGINLAAPFLMLGIGIDDTFVMLGAWRRTSIHDSVPKRMEETFKDAAVSITITSLTDMLSFWVGVITPFPCVRIFCVYTGACVIFTYAWHVTLFGAFMAISGYAERQNRHALTCLPVIPKSRSSKCPINAQGRCYLQHVPKPAESLPFDLLLLQNPVGFFTTSFVLEALTKKTPYIPKTTEKTESWSSSGTGSHPCSTTAGPSSLSF